MDFILSQRLGWELPITPRGGKPFEEEGDVKVLRNDWPYGIDGRIVHLVVWTKFGLEDDEETGDLTGEARRVIEGWVRGRFGKVPRENVSCCCGCESWGGDVDGMLTGCIGYLVQELGVAQVGQVG